MFKLVWFKMIYLPYLNTSRIWAMLHLQTDHLHQPLWWKPVRTRKLLSTEKNISIDLHMFRLWETPGNNPVCMNVTTQSKQTTITSKNINVNRVTVNRCRAMLLVWTRYDSFFFKTCNMKISWLLDYSIHLIFESREQSRIQFSSRQIFPESETFNFRIHVC